MTTFLPDEQKYTIRDPITNMYNNFINIIKDTDSHRLKRWY